MNNRGNNISAVAKALKEKENSLLLIKEVKATFKKPLKKKVVKSVKKKNVFNSPQWKMPTPMNIKSVQYKSVNNNERVAVLAGSFTEYKHFLSENRENDLITHFIYIDDPNHVRGMELKYFIIIGTFWKNQFHAEHLFNEMRREVERNTSNNYHPF